MVKSTVNKMNSSVNVYVYIVSSVPLAMSPKEKQNRAASRELSEIRVGEFELGEIMNEDYKMQSMVEKAEAELPHYAADGKGTKVLRACFSAWNQLSGAGIIALPFTLSRSGWFGLTMLLTLAMITCYTAILLHRCMQTNSNIKTYPDVGFCAFGPAGRTLVSMFMFLELYLVSVGFLILEGENLHKLFPDVVFRVGNVEMGGKWLFTIISGILILPSMWVTDMRKLTIVSVCGISSSLVILGCLFWIGTIDGVSFHGEGKLFDLGGVPTALSLITFCYGAHPLFPTLYSSMQEKSQFPKVIFFSFSISTLNYMLTAVLGYAMFGQNVRSQITLNLPSRKTSTKIAVCMTLISPVAKYTLIITPVAEAIEKKLPVYYYHIRIIRFLLRTTLLISTLFVALLFPFFGSLMALIGSILNVAVSILLPCLCYLKISNAYRKRGWEVTIIVAILGLGLTVAVLGTYSAIKEITRRRQL